MPAAAFEQIALPGALSSASAAVSVAGPMRYFAPAKVNLSLRVLRRRPDGFHEIETLMAPLSLADELTIEPGGEGIAFSCDDPSLPGDETNLVHRAAALFYERAKRPASVRIALKKNVPHGAGLGGGSSDAAATLLALNELYGIGFSPETLAEIAAELGSDIPFFVFRSAAICRGRGEQVEPVALGEKVPLLLLKPPFAISTPWAYSHWLDAKKIPGTDEPAEVFPWGELVNDLEAPVFEKYIFLGHLKKWLRAQPESAGALMSGSGSTMFAVLRAGNGAEALASRARREFGDSLWCCPCTTL
jgi:4-diphosphocytidyl-2-C-methyl-D-erythritol kinase